MHFFNPVHRMPLVEVIRGEKIQKKQLLRSCFFDPKGKSPKLEK
jgi:3-hydroxyacyl-CoA dehydrogenase